MNFLFKYVLIQSFIFSLAVALNSNEPENTDWIRLYNNDFENLRPKEQLFYYINNNLSLNVINMQNRLVIDENAASNGEYKIKYFNRIK